ncbi:hypothetical protein BCR34DRAFT_595745 [Clohesyomyces aquaticus]|uniref:RING-type domain-containing protein n=1 Tax=Clohesyomyces aquaticus TaxID=1231657 RepID=A0A1Y2AA06_9PLEO|nr:hypothetical protein BCR34DRAFT_595745 [Clohesyomyces aquaticus]
MPFHFHLRRRPREVQTGASLHVTLSVDVETSYENAWSREGTPLGPAPSPTPFRSSSVVRASLAANNHARGDAPWYALPEASTSAALVAIAQHTARGFHPGAMLLTIPEPPPDFRIIDVDEASRLATSLLSQIVSYGQMLRKSELSPLLPKTHDNYGATEPCNLSHWLAEVDAVKSRDRPLFYILRESLHSHTPHHVLSRWDLLRQRLASQNETITSIVRRAERCRRSEWTEAMREFFSLLLDHTEALINTEPTLEPYFGSLESQLSALAMALRIRYYLFRMTRKIPLCGNRTYKFQLCQSGIRNLMRKLDELLAQELARMHDPVFGHFRSTERELVGAPVRIDSITVPAKGRGTFFCSICQDHHLQSRSVQTRNCQCVFGKECLEHILNRDTPFSNACPNCRTQLHEPLQWATSVTRDQRDWRAVLIWNLRSNVHCLKKEIHSDPVPFTKSELISGWFRRLIRLE